MKNILTPLSYYEVRMSTSWIRCVIFFITSLYSYYRKKDQPCARKIEVDNTISVKKCATVADMLQKLDHTAFRRGAQLASQANFWTGYASPARTNRLSNHILNSGNKKAPILLLGASVTVYSFIFIHYLMNFT